MKRSRDVDGVGQAKPKLGAQVRGGDKGRPINR
jgi:hypothetical protein